MPVLDVNLTDLDTHQVQSEPGMAHFAGTGPRGKTCGHCVFWGYKRETGRFNSMKPVKACQQYVNLTGKHGPAIKAALLSCKYFEEIPTP